MLALPKRLLLPVLLGLGLIAGCGSHHHASSHATFTQHSYTVTLPSGQKVQAAHPQTFGVPTGKFRLARPSFQQTVLMLDTVNTATMSGLRPVAVAGYTGGRWPTYSPLVSLFPHAAHIAVMINAGFNGVASATRSCLDVEPGDAVSWQAGPWVAGQLLAPVRPCVYTSLSVMPEVISSLNGAHIPRSRYMLWDANWTYVYHLDQGFDCTQWTDHYLNRNIDGSACTPAFLGVSPPDPYRKYPKTRFTLRFGQHASEHATVRTWDVAGCEHPPRRATCKSSVFHLRLLRDRAVFVAHHALVRGRWVALSRPRYDYADLGARIHGLEARITARPGHKCSPATCG